MVFVKEKGLKAEEYKDRAIMITAATTTATSLLHSVAAMQELPAV